MYDETSDDDNCTRVVSYGIQSIVRFSDECANATVLDCFPFSRSYKKKKRIFINLGELLETTYILIFLKLCSSLDRKVTFNIELPRSPELLST